MPKAKFTDMPPLDVEVLAVACALASLPMAWEREDARRQDVNVLRETKNITLAKRSKPLLALLPPMTDAEKADAINRELAPIKKRDRPSAASIWNPAAAEPKDLYDAIQSDLAFVATCLNALRKRARLPHAMWEKWATKYLRNLGGSVTPAEPTILKTAGGPILHFQPQFTGVASVVAYAVALAADPRYEARKRLGVCRRCGRHFIGVTKGKGQFRKDFCSKQHMNAHKSHTRRHPRVEHGRAPSRFGLKRATKVSTAAATDSRQSTKE